MAFTHKIIGIHKTEYSTKDQPVYRIRTMQALKELLLQENSQEDVDRFIQKMEYYSRDSKLYQSTSGNLKMGKWTWFYQGRERQHILSRSASGKDTIFEIASYVNLGKG